ncbi:MAG TPA: DUF2726 domain-containing protein [Pantanalinema sp.]
MIIGILGALIIAGLIGLGLVAMRDPEGGLVAQDLPALIVPKEALLDPNQARVFALLEGIAGRENLAIFPRARLETAFDPGRLTHTGWHRMRQAPVDFLLAHRDTLAPAGLILLEGGEKATYLEEENRQMKESAIAESGVPLLKVSISPDKPLDVAAEEVLAWVRDVVRYSEGSRTQVDLL